MQNSSISFALLKETVWHEWGGSWVSDLKITTPRDICGVYGADPDKYSVKGILHSSIT